MDSKINVKVTHSPRLSLILLSIHVLISDSSQQTVASVNLMIRGKVEFILASNTNYLLIIFFVGFKNEG